MPSGFRIQASFGLAVAAVLTLTPLAINHFLQGRYLLGIGTLLVAIVLAAHASLQRSNREPGWLAPFVLVPAIFLAISLSMQYQGAIGVLWSYPALLVVYVLLHERAAWIANAIFLAIAIPQAYLVVEPALVYRVVATLGAVSIFSAILVRAIENAQSQLRELAETDSLTGLYNRVTLDEELERAQQQLRRSGTPMSLLAMDLDNFKAVNDDFGHAVGDEVLRQLGEMMRRRFRSIDQLFRVGGEEFLVLLYDSDSQTAKSVAEEFRAMVEAEPMLDGRMVTISIGIATLQPDESASSWRRRADIHLYQAKDNGRNCVVGDIVEAGVQSATV